MDRFPPPPPAAVRRPNGRRWWAAMAALLVVVLASIPLRTSILERVAPVPDPPTERVAARAGWNMFRAPDGSYQVEGPGSPSVSPVSTEMGPAHAARFAGGLQVVWSDRRVSDSPDDRVLADVVGRLLRPLVGLVADEEADLEVDGHPGFGLSVTSDGQHLAARVFIADGRFFEVLGIDGDDPTGAAGEAFVRSFLLRV